MAIVPNAAELPVLMRVDYIADTLGELELAAAGYVNSYVLVRETGKLYRVAVDTSVNDTKFLLSTVEVMPGALLFIQPDQPVVEPGTKYLWIKTEAGPNNDQFDILVSVDGT